MEDLSFSYRKEHDWNTGKTVKTLDAENIEKIIAWYLDNNGQVIVLEESVIGYGKLLCTGVDGYPSILITERFLNEWSSDHYFRCINKLSKKLLKEMEKATGYYETWYAK